MRAKNRAIGVVGAAIGVVMVVAAAVAPASARPASEATASVTATYSCASFEGLKITAPSVSYSGVGLRTGETITATVTPASTGDKILVFAAIGFNFYGSDGPATQPVPFRSGLDAVWALSWSYILPDNTTSKESRTWTFDCSSTTVAAPAPTASPTPTTAPAPVKRHGKPRP
jgi:hypothetical protein